MITESDVTDSAFGGAVTSDMMKEMADALTIQLDRDVSAYWGGNFRVRAGKDASDIAPNEIVCALVRSLPDTPGAVAYHSKDGATRPFVMVAHMQCNSIFDGPDSISNAFSHELNETSGDPACNGWYDDGNGKEHAGELSDATQGDNYKIGRVTVSNFVLRDYFNAGSIGPYSYLGMIGQDPIPIAFGTALGGYQIVRTASSDETQVDGKKEGLVKLVTKKKIEVVGSLRNLDRKKHWVSRTYKRGARLAESV